jgi:hypothetical protein
MAYTVEDLPSEPPSDPALLMLYVRDAQPTSERERINDAQVLLLEEALAAPVEHLRAGRTWLTRKIAAKARVKRAMNEVEQRRSRAYEALRNLGPYARSLLSLIAPKLHKLRAGRHDENEYRDFIAAVEAESRLTRMNRKKAYHEVAELMQVGIDVVRNAYATRDLHEVAVEMSRRKFEELD